MYMNKESRMFQTTLLVNKYIFLSVFKTSTKEIKISDWDHYKGKYSRRGQKMALSLDKHQIPLTLSLPRSDW